MNTLRVIYTRQLWIFGLAAAGLALTAPVQAAPDLMDGAFMVAQRDRSDAVRQDQRDTRRDDSAGADKRRASKREAVRDEPQGYGYGYERRQQQRFEDDGRPRGRR